LIVLVDTSVWVGHLKRRDATLAALLDEGRVATHAFVLGELALGGLRRRAEILELLAALPSARLVSHEEALAFVEAHELDGTGVGWVDLHLLASAQLDGLRLRTLDTRLAAVARRLGLGA